MMNRMTFTDIRYAGKTIYSHLVPAAAPPGMSRKSLFKECLYPLKQFEEILKVFEELLQ